MHTAPRQLQSGKLGTSALSLDLNNSGVLLGGQLCITQPNYINVTLIVIVAVNVEQQKVFYTTLDRVPK